MIRFVEANVIHLGDLYFNGSYPFIDVDSGGSIEGYVAAIDAILPTIDEATKIVPGHGPLAGKRDLKAYRDILADVSLRVKTMVVQRKTREQVIAAKPTAAWDEAWGKGFMKPDMFTGLVYDSIAQRR